MSEEIDRREFSRWMVGGIAGAGVAGQPPWALAAAEPADKRPSLPALVLARIIEEFPSMHYDANVIDNILNDVRSDLARSRELSAFPLQNGDEPAFIFPAARHVRRMSSLRKAP